MIRRRMILLLASAVLACADSGARAAVLPGEWFASAGLGLGLASPGRQTGAFNGQYPDPFNPGTVHFVAPYDFLVQPRLVFGQVLYHLTPSWGLGLNYARLSLGGPIENEVGATASGPIPMRVRNHESINDDGTILAVARFVFSPETNWSPYALGGIGVKLTSISGSFVADAPGTTCAIPSQCAPINKDVFGRSWTPAAAAGFGIERSLGDAATAGVGANFYYVGSTTVGGVLVHAEKVVALQANVGFHLGGMGRR